VPGLVLQTPLQRLEIHWKKLCHLENRTNARSLWGSRPGLDLIHGRIPSQHVLQR
jgi:hypothetical protein